MPRCTSIPKRTSIWQPWVGENYIFDRDKEESYLYPHHLMSWKLFICWPDNKNKWNCWPKQVFEADDFQMTVHKKLGLAVNIFFERHSQGFLFAKLQAGWPKRTGHICLRDIFKAPMARLQGRIFNGIFPQKSVGFLVDTQTDFWSTMVYTTV
jgi:hypothetical protein